MASSVTLPTATTPGARPRVLVVGAGKMGLLHGGLLRASRQADVAGIVDLSFSARRIAGSMGLKVKTFASMDAALKKDPNVTACFVCTPPGSHAAVSRAALERGLDVFVEKPLTVSAEKSRELAALAKSRGQVGVVGYVRRHHVIYRRLRDLIEASSAPLREIRVRIRSPQFANAGADAGLHRGGLEWDLMPHVVDMALWLVHATKDPEIVSTQWGSHERVSANATLGDTSLALEADWACRDVRKVELDVALTFADGARAGCDEDVAWRMGPDGERQILLHRRDVPPPWFDIAGAEFSAQTLDVISAFQRGVSSSATFEEAARVETLIETCIARHKGAAS